MSDHFHNLQQSPAFEYLVTSTSAKDLKKIQRKLYSNLFSISNHCWRKNSAVKNVLLELSVFRRYLLLIIGNNKSKQYKDLWKKIVTSSIIKQKYFTSSWVFTDHPTYKRHDRAWIFYDRTCQNRFLKSFMT